jgi:hypothetical protein
MSSNCRRWLKDSKKVRSACLSALSLGLIGGDGLEHGLEPGEQLATRHSGASHDEKFGHRALIDRID